MSLVALPISPFEEPVKTPARRLAEKPKKLTNEELYWISYKAHVDHAYIVNNMFQN